MDIKKIACLFLIDRTNKPDEELIPEMVRKVMKGRLYIMA